MTLGAAMPGLRGKDLVPGRAGEPPSEASAAHSRRCSGRPCFTVAAASFHNMRIAPTTTVCCKEESTMDVSAHHEHLFSYNEENTLPLPFEKMGIKGLSFPKVDISTCTYCSLVSGPIVMSFAQAWKGEPWSEAEILTGKVMGPTPDKKKTILLGKCIYEKNKNHPDIEEMIAIKECPPQPKNIVKAFHRAGIEINPAVLEHLQDYPGLAMKKYRGKPEFDESFFRNL
jgi:hypothetical protein